MATTTYLDPAFTASAFQSRTDAAGTDVVDVDGPEVRLPWSAYSEGVIGADAYEVTAAGGSMTITVGSGTAFADLAVVAGDTASLGKYGLLLEPATQNVTVPAADLSNPRIDQLFLVVVDDPGTMVKARIGYRQGDAGSSPAAPGPDSGWEGSLLLATVAVGAGVTEIVQGDITDERVFTTPTVASGSTVSAFGELVSGTSIGTSNTTFLSVPITIPASWSTYTLKLWTGGRVTADADANLNLNLDVDGTNYGGLLLEPEGTSHTLSLNWMLAGEATTGSRTVILEGSRTGGTSGSIFPTLFVEATRTS